MKQKQMVGKGRLWGKRKGSWCVIANRGSVVVAVGKGLHDSYH